MSIEAIPRLPQAIKEAVNNDRLAVFIGAGISRLAGCLGWDELARKLIERCFKEQKANGDNCITFKEKETLSYINDHKKVITICYHILKNNGHEEQFYDVMRRALKGDEKDSANIYDVIRKLRGLCVTTNADEFFDRKFGEQNLVYKESDFKSDRLDRTKLYHIHGSIKEPESLVFTVDKYIRRYRGNPDFRSFLQEIFGKYTILFVGYGLAEFEMLDYVITNVGADQQKKHFVLEGFFSGEDNILEFHKYYYSSLGINVVPYLKDMIGFRQIIKVIGSWEREINQTTTFLYDSFQELEEAAINHEPSKENRIMGMIQNDIPLRDHFFKQLSVAARPDKWLKILYERGYFDPKNNPTPIEDVKKPGTYTIPYWPVLGVLDNTVKQNLNRDDKSISNTILEIIDSIISFERVENYNTDSSMVRIISHLLINEITEKHLKFIGSLLKSRWSVDTVFHEINDTLIPKLITEKHEKYLLIILDYILEFKKDNANTYDKYEPLMSGYWLSDCLTKIKPELANICPREVANIAFKKINTVVNEDSGQFNYIWIQTIEDHEQQSFSDRYDIQLVRLLRDMYVGSDPWVIRNDIEKLLRMEHDIFKRIAIYVINFHFKILSDLIFESNTNFIDNIFLKHEFYEFLKAHVFEFSPPQYQVIIKWIEISSYWIPDEIKDDEEKKNRYLACRKKEWLNALLGSNNEQIKILYDMYNNLCPGEVSHPGFLSWHESSFGSISPINEDVFSKMSTCDTANYLNTFVETRGFKTPTEEGLADTLRVSVNHEPLKYSKDLISFLKVKRIYQNAILRGFYESWNQNKSFDWSNVLIFTLEIVESHEFWAIDGNSKYFTKDWMVSSISSLIENGTRDDSNAFDPKLLPLAEKIVIVLMNKSNSNIKDVDVNSVLNSPLGQVYSAAINLSLRHARVYEIKKTNRWIESIKDEFTKRLDGRESISVDFSINLGRYLPNLRYLDQKWVKDNFRKIFCEEIDKHWRATMLGYLFYCGVYQYLYFLVKEDEFYSKAIRTVFSEEYVYERLTQHICIGYLEGWEEIEKSDSLITQIINNGDHKHLSEIVRFFSHHEVELRYNPKVKPLWKQLFNHLNTKVGSNKDYEPILADLSRWIDLINEIDEEICEWLKISVKYHTHFSDIVFKNYVRHIQKTPKYVGEIYLEVARNNLIAPYYTEDVKGLVRSLYEHNEFQSADKICNLYAERGYDFLKDIFVEFNKK